MGRAFARRSFSRAARLGMAHELAGVAAPAIQKLHACHPAHRVPCRETKRATVTEEPRFFTPLEWRASFCHQTSGVKAKSLALDNHASFRMTDQISALPEEAQTCKHAAVVLRSFDTAFTEQLDAVTRAFTRRGLMTRSGG